MCTTIRHELHVLYVTQGMHSWYSSRPMPSLYVETQAEDEQGLCVLAL